MRQEHHGQRDSNGCESSSSNVWLLKIWAPLLWLVWAVGLFKDDVFSVRIVGCIPFVLAFVFHMSLAIVRIREGRVQYRRFLKWKPVEISDVLWSGVVWLPFIGFMRLRKSQPPWGRLFFVLDSESGRRSVGRDGSGILGYLRRTQQMPSNSVKSADPSGLHYRKLIVACGCGILASLMRVFLSQTFAPGATGHVKNPSSLAESAARVLAYVGNPQFAIPLLVGFVLLSVFLRNRPSAWSFAFLAGVVIPFALCSGLMR
jgi:hypothetical protein